MKFTAIGLCTCLCLQGIAFSAEPKTISQKKLQCHYVIQQRRIAPINYEVVDKEHHLLTGYKIVVQNLKTGKVEKFFVDKGRYYRVRTPFPTNSFWTSNYFGDAKVATRFKF